MANTVSKNHDGLIRKGNHILEELRSDLLLANYLPFGQAFSSAPGQLVARSLVAHRIVNKWHRPDNSLTTRLKTECFDNWKAHENNLWNFEFTRNSMNSWHWKAADNIRTWLKPFKREFTNLWTLENMSLIDLDFTPGETFKSAQGKVSVKQKLMAEKWTVTYNLLDWAVLLVNKHSTLKRVAYAKLFNYILHPDMLRLKNAVAAGHMTADDMFNDACKIFLFQVVNGARASSVPKNNKVRRFINIEPLFNVLFQRSIALIICKTLKQVGNNLEDGQHVHRELIRFLRFSTLDLRNASDSNLFDAAEVLLGTACPELWSCIQAGRSYTTTFTYPNGDVEEVVNKKLSSMGNGFTFEVMTLILLSQSRVVDPESRVYGDDIIIQTKFAEQYIHQISLSGWSVNTDKTFIEGNFRESCGGFYHSELGDLVSYDIEYLVSFQDLITVCNKLRLILEFIWEENVAKAHDALVRLVPALHKGPIRNRVVPSFNPKGKFKLGDHNLNIDYVEVGNCQQAYRGSKDSRDVYSRHLRTLVIARELDLLNSRVLGCIKIPRFKPKKLSVTTRVVHDPFTLAHYLYSNRVTDDVLRGKGYWSNVTCYVLNDGHVLPVATVKSWIRSFKTANQVGPKPSCYHTSLIEKREADMWFEVWDHITITAG